MNNKLLFYFYKINKGFFSFFGVLILDTPPPLRYWTHGTTHHVKMKIWWRNDLFFIKTTLTFTAFLFYLFVFCFNFPYIFSSSSFDKESLLCITKSFSLLLVSLSLFSSSPLLSCDANNIRKHSCSSARRDQLYTCTDEK